MEFEKIDIKKLRDLPIEGVASRLGLTVRAHKSLCPFHDDSRPSLTFNVRKNTYRCYVCNAYGGPIDLVMRHLGKSFVEACKWLADEHNVVLTEYKSHKVQVEKLPQVDRRHLATLMCQPYLNDEAKRFLFEERGIKPGVVKLLGLSSISSPVPMSGDLKGSWFHAPSLLIPYKDVEGNIVSVQARYLGNDPTKPRFQFPKGSVCSIFNLPVLKTLKPGSVLFVSEGVSDCLALMSMGYPAIAIPSATLLKQREKQLLASWAKTLSLTLHIYPDRDRPGERLFLDLKAFIPNMVRHQLPDGFKDVGQYYAYIHEKSRKP